MLRFLWRVINIDLQGGFNSASPLETLEVLVMTEEQGKFGFTQFAENWNGRLAMLGFIVGLATEYLTGKGILEQLGLM